MARRHPERVREVVHAAAVVEESCLDQPQRARDAGGRAAPGRCSGRRLGPTSQARTKPRALGGGRRGEEHDVGRPGGFDRTRGPAIDPCRQHAGEEAPVEPRVAGALLTMVIGGVYERFGPRAVVAVGSLAMAVGLAALGLVTRPWQLYPVFLVMALGWGSMSGAAINIILAPWWERRRGLAVSIAFNGATLGGVLLTPMLIPLIAALGFPRALVTAGFGSFAIVIAVAVLVMRSGPHTRGLGPDGETTVAARAAPHVLGERGGRGDALRTWRFWSVSAPFALGLAAQVGVLTHLVALVGPTLGAGGAARAVGVTTAAALVGRLLTGVVVDRVNRRVVASATLVVQMLGLALLATAPSAAAVYAGCVLFGLGVGNLTTLPGLILAVEWPRERFAALVALAVGINQFTFAFGPSLVGITRDQA